MKGAVCHPSPPTSSHMHQHSSLHNLPFELLERIIDQMSSCRDLLHLALANRRFYGIIIPDHLECRTVRSLAGDIYLWRRLLQHPLIASRVRFLHLESEFVGWIPPSTPAYWYRIQPSPLIPSRLLDNLQQITPDNKTYALQERLDSLVKALPLMDRLVRFTCHVYRDSHVAFKDVLEMLLNYSTSLQEFEIHYAINDQQSSINAPTILSQIPKFSNLTRFSYTLSGPNIFQETHYLDLVFALITNFPHLEDLCLRFGFWGARAPLQSFIEHGFWPKLCRLTLAGYLDLYNVQNACLVEAFFRRHDLLRYVSLDGVKLLPKNVIFTDMLPNIVSFDIRVSLITQHQVLSSQLGMDVASRLSFFAGAISSNCLPFIATMTNLRACDLDFSPSALYLLSDFAACAPPNIEKLYLPAHPACSQDGAFDKMIDPSLLIRDIIGAMSPFKTLTHLGGLLRHVQAFTEKGNEIIGQLSRINSLKYVEVTMSNHFEKSRGWIELERSGGHEMSMGFHQVNSDGLAVHSWGGFFYGFP